MKMRWKEVGKEERGNVALFVMGILSIMMVLFIFVVNMGMAFSVKEKSGTTAQQASMAATSVLYEEVRKTIEEYEDDTLEGKLLAFFEEFDEKVSDAKSELESDSSYIKWTNNELELEALDIVLAEALDKDVIRSKLKEILHAERIEEDMAAMARETIVQNGGVLNGAEMAIRDNRVYVRAANEMEATSYNGFMEGVQEEIYQESAGPKVNFLEDIWGVSFVVSLDE